MPGLFLGCVVVGLIGLVVWAFSSSDGESEGSVAVAPRKPLQDLAPDGYRGIAMKFGDAAHDLLRRVAEEQGRLSLGRREGQVSVHDRGDHIAWEARDNRGRLIDSGRIDDLGRMR